MIGQETHGTTSARRTLLVAGSVLLALPMAALVFVALAEMAGSDVAGSQRLLGAVPLLLILLVALHYPRAVGIALIAMSSVLFAIWLLLLVPGVINTTQDTSIWMWLAGGLVLLFPAFSSGVLFYLSSLPYAERTRT